MVWNFFATGHSKGEVDGVGALLKRELRVEQIKLDIVRLQSASDIVAYLKSRLNRWHAGHPKLRQKVNNFFYDIGKNDVDCKHPYGVQTITSSRSMHQVRSKLATDSSICEFRQLSCFCVGCMDPLSDLECANEGLVPWWEPSELMVIPYKDRVSTRERKSTAFPHSIDYSMVHLERSVSLVDDIDKSEFHALDTKMKADVYDDPILPGHNIAVHADLDEEPFWLMLVDKGAHKVESCFTDYYGNS